MAQIDDFTRLDIRIGRIARAEQFPEARRPAYKLWIEFGPEIGEKRSSAQIVDLYQPEELVGRQVVAVVNFPPLQVGPFQSEVLVLGTYTDDGVVLLQPEREAPLGAKIG